MSLPTEVDNGRWNIRNGTDLGPSRLVFPSKYSQDRVIRESSKKILDCNAARPQFRDANYLDLGIAGGPANCSPVPDLNGTRFRPGFWRRQKTDIHATKQFQDKFNVERKKVEDCDFRMARNLLKDPRDTGTFNIITGEGVRARPLVQFRPCGKLITNAAQKMTMYPQHEKDSKNRQLQSLHRFFL